MRLGCHSITWGGVVGNATGVTSIKDLTYRAAGDLEQALADIAAAGYAGVEIFDGNLEPYADDVGRLRGLLEQHQLELVSVYVGAGFVYDDALPDELFRIGRSARLAALAGAGCLVVGGGARRAAGTTDTDWERLVSALDRVTDLAEEAGMPAAFHPHLTTMVEGPDEVRRVLAGSRIGFCPDTAHLAAGGGDPVALVREHADRIVHVHLKDWRPPATFLPLGAGEVDLPGVLDALHSSDYDGWLVVELDEHGDAPIDAAASSYRYLVGLLGDPSPAADGRP